MVKMEKAVAVEQLKVKRPRTEACRTQERSDRGAVHDVTALIGAPIRHSATPFSTMPPISFFGLVTKAGFMDKTATVTVSRWVFDAKTGKVRHHH
jgi:ribosomal protein S17